MTKKDEFDIAIDFDGVIHSYSSGWQGPSNIPDPPFAGAMDWLNNLTKAGIKWCVFSARNLFSEGPPAILSWLEENGCDIAHLNLKDHFPAKKPHADMFLDDRGMRFEGDYSTLTPEFIKNTKPWYKQNTRT